MGVSARSVYIRNWLIWADELFEASWRTVRFGLTADEPFDLGCRAVRLGLLGCSIRANEFVGPG